MENTGVKQRVAPVYLRSARHWRCTAHPRKHSSVYADPAAQGCSSRSGVRTQASKGFGNVKEAQVTGFRR